MNAFRAACALLVLCFLAVLAYYPAQTLPFIADDYLQIQLGRDYGPLQNWAALLHDPLYRCRATSVLLTHWTELLFKLDPIPYNLSSLVLHIANAIGVFALGIWAVIGWRKAFFAAAFFAIAEGHQEAVMWYSALPELLVFLFIGLCVLSFILFLRGGRRRWLFYGLALISFLLALASKESGVVAVGGIVLIAAIEKVPWPRSLLLVAPFTLAACLYIAAIFHASGDILHFHDGTFELTAPFAATILRSCARMLWIWGFAAIAVLASFDRRGLRTVIPAALVWMVISLFPYSFLTYMDRVPSRHTYLASVGLSLLAGGAFTHIAALRRKEWAALAALLVVGQNCGYLWTKKMRQYEQRAQPTEQLIRMHSGDVNTVRIECFPYSRWIAKYAVEVGAGKPWSDSNWQPRQTCRPEEIVLRAEKPIDN